MHYYKKVNSETGAVTTLSSSMEYTADPAFVAISEEEYAIASQPAAVLLTAAQAKSATWTHIKTERDRRENGGYLVGSVWYHSDALSLMKYNTILGMATEKSFPVGTVVAAAWKDMAGNFAPMTVATLRAIRDTGVAKVAAIYAAAEQHRVTMEASADPAVYDFSGGWPGIYEA